MDFDKMVPKNTSGGEITSAHFNVNWLQVKLTRTINILIQTDVHYNNQGAKLVAKGTNIFN